MFSAFIRLLFNDVRNRTNLIFTRFSHGLVSARQHPRFLFGIFLTKKKSLRWYHEGAHNTLWRRSSLSFHNNPDVFEVLHVQVLRGLLSLFNQHFTEPDLDINMQIKRHCYAISVKKWRLLRKLQDNVLMFPNLCLYFYSDDLLSILYLFASYFIGRPLKCAKSHFRSSIQYCIC